MTASSSYEKTKVLVAGIGGASLGTEIIKALDLAGKYRIFGCDISPQAYGHFMPEVERSWTVARENYAANITEIARENAIAAIIPGGDEPAVLLGQHAAVFAGLQIPVVGNAPDVVALCADKGKFFSWLQAHDIEHPQTRTVRQTEEIGAELGVSFPCIVKPATGSGGSANVFLANSAAQARLYIEHILQSGTEAVLQEYIGLDEGEWTIGVLSLPDGRVAGSMAMQRIFHTKLSIGAKTEHGLISSGYSQGKFDEFPELRAQAETMARALNSRGPLNIQGRVRKGRLLPFEINPRFSASTYLRTLAGWNEIDTLLDWLLHGIEPQPPQVRAGYYLRSLTETFVPDTFA